MQLEEYYITIRLFQRYFRSWNRNGIIDRIWLLNPENEAPIRIYIWKGSNFPGNYYSIATKENLTKTAKFVINEF